MAVNLRGYVGYLEVRAPSHGEAGWRRDRQHVLSGCVSGRTDPPGVCHRQGRHRRAIRHVASRWGREGIRCNTVAPGFTATEAIRAAPQWPDLEAAALRRIRADRVGATDDVAALVAFLLSETRVGGSTGR